MTHSLDLAAFWNLGSKQRQEMLWAAVARSHQYHYQRNYFYRNTVASRGAGEVFRQEAAARLLRPTAQTFKSYVEYIGTPFPEENPPAFWEWLVLSLSSDLPRHPNKDFPRRKYLSLEALLSHIERTFSYLGLEILTSSGTSGKASIIVKDSYATQLTVKSFYLCFQRYFGMRADHRVIFLMPARSRIAMARMARFSVEHIALDKSKVFYAIPLPAHPDLVRIRTGRLYKSGIRGLGERKILQPLLGKLQSALVDPKALDKALHVLKQAVQNKEKVLLFGSLTQLHQLALRIAANKDTIQLPFGSLVGSGGGIKELYPFSPQEIRAEISQRFVFEDGSPVSCRDVYGMAEASWAAMQCSAGNYHLPPWVLAFTVDEDGEICTKPISKGLLAFFDPVGGGSLYPPFFRTADEVLLVQDDDSTCCPCGERGAYLVRDSIQRVDFLGEAGCAAQL